MNKWGEFVKTLYLLSGFWFVLDECGVIWRKQRLLDYVVLKRWWAIVVFLFIILQHCPVFYVDTVDCFSAVDSGEFEWPMYECV